MTGEASPDAGRPSAVLGAGAGRLYSCRAVLSDPVLLAVQRQILEHALHTALVGQYGTVEGAHHRGRGRRVLSRTHALRDFLLAASSVEVATIPQASLAARPQRPAGLLRIVR